MSVTVIKNIIVFLAIFSFVFCDDSNDTRPPRVQPKKDYFFYFAYGSNLLTNRMHINVPGAEFYSIGELKGWRLEFYHYEANWNGAVATIVQDPNSTVWGTVWQVKLDDVPYLDKQEGVDRGFYYGRIVRVRLPTGSEVDARTYIETDDWVAAGANDTLPSRTYHMVIVLGAIESKLPADYVNHLLDYETNNQVATEQRRQQLGYPFYDEN